MATEEIRIALKADTASFEEGLNRAGISINRFNKHLKSSFKETVVNKKGVLGLRKEFGVFDGVVQRIQKSTLTASQINKQFTQSFQKQMDIMDVKPIGTFAQKMEEAGLSQKQWNKHAKENFLTVQDGVGVYDKMTGQVVSYGTAIKQATIQGRRFKMEWLGIMFAGMALDRAFGGLMRTQMQLFGVTDMMSGMWTIVLLPIMELITPLIFAMLDAFMNMPRGVQMAIGIFILFGAILGKILLVGGQIMLFHFALKGLGLKLGGVFTKLGKIFSLLWKGILIGIKFVIANFLPIAAVIAGIALIVTGLFMVFKKKFEGIGLIIMGIGVILLLFIGWWALIPIAVGAAVFLIIKHWDKIKSFFSRLWGWIKNIFKVGWEWVKWIFFHTNPVGIIIKNWTKLKSFFKNLWKTIKNIFSGAWDWIKNLFKNIKNAIKDLIPSWMIKIIKGFNPLKGINVLGKLVGFQSGGLVTETGPAFLHAGERVIPKGRVSNAIVFSPTINLNTSINNDMDVRILAEQLNRFWAADFERLMQGRGST